MLTPRLPNAKMKIHYMVSVDILKAIFYIIILFYLLFLISLFFAANKDALTKIDIDSELPTHHAAQHNFLESLEYLLDISPDTALEATITSSILPYAIQDNRTETGLFLEKIAYICKEYPILVYGRNEDGFTPMHYALFLKL